MQTPRPFLKWVGGKTQLLPELVKRVARAGSFQHYHEPFVGGGALFFEMYRSGILADRRCTLSDANPRLMETYQAVKEDTERLIKLLGEHQEKHSTEYFYARRAQVPKTRTARAARVIYLNKTCFNGLYRENSRGEFNVPIGKYKNPLICDAENLREVAKALATVEMGPRHYRMILDQAQAGDLVYFDPPYHPISTTSNFTAYAQDNFGAADQAELGEVCAALDARGVKFILSNSYTPLIQEIYQKFQIEEVLANRMINSKSDQRGKISEALVHNLA